jgi:O-antigen/teichoic acid export membrane protein
MSQENRLRRSLLNYAASMTFVGVTAVTGFITTPWLIRWLTREKLGACRALVEWLGIIGLLEVGLTTSLTAELALAVARKDSQRLRAVLRAGFLAFTILAGVLLLCVVVFAGFVPYLIKIDPAEVPDLRMGVFISACAFLVYPLLSLRALAEARGQAYVLQLAFTLQSLLLTGLALLFAARGGGISGQAAATVIASLVLIVVLLSVYRADFLEAWVFQGGETREVSRRLWRINHTAALSGLWGKFQQSGAMLLVAAILGSTHSLDVNVSQRLLFALGPAVFAVGGSTWAGLSEAHYQRKGGAVAPLLTVSSLTSTLAAGVLIPAAAINRSFFQAWLGNEATYLGEWFSILSAVGIFLYSLANLWTMTLIGVGGLARLARPLALAIVLGVLLGGAATWWFGEMGTVVVVDGVMALMLAGPIPLLLRELLGIPLRPLLTRVAFPWLVAAVPAAGLFAATHWHEPRNVFEAGGWCAAYGVVYAFLAWRWILTGAERSHLLKR